MRRNNKKGVVLLPWTIILSLLVTLVFSIVYYQYSKTQKLTDNYLEYQKTNLSAGKNDLQAMISNGKMITNSKLTEFGQQIYDDTTSDNLGQYGDGTYGNGTEMVNEGTAIIDKTSTNRVSNITRLGEREPDKGNNVFEIDLVDFLKTDGTSKGSIPAGELTLRYGRKPENTPPVYLIMGRIEKNATINLDRNYEINLSKKKFGDQDQFGTSSDTVDQHAFNYIKIDQPLNCDSPTVGKDPTIGEPDFSWCKTIRLNDILGGTNGTEFNLRKYMYKVYVVFGFTGTNDSLTPFKLENPNTGTFGVGNFIQSDLTALTGDNSRRRIFIKQATKGNSLPYTIYTLWVKGEIKIESDPS